MADRIYSKHTGVVSEGQCFLPSDWYGLPAENAWIF